MTPTYIYPRPQLRIFPQSHCLSAQNLDPRPGMQAEKERILHRLQACIHACMHACMHARSNHAGTPTWTGMHAHLHEYACMQVEHNLSMLQWKAEDEPLIEVYLARVCAHAYARTQALASTHACARTCTCTCTALWSPSMQDLNAASLLQGSGGMLHFGCEKDKYALQGQ